MLTNDCIMFLNVKINDDFCGVVWEVPFTKLELVLAEQENTSTDGCTAVLLWYLNDDNKPAQAGRALQDPREVSCRWNWRSRVFAVQGCYHTALVRSTTTLQAVRDRLSHCCGCNCWRHEPPLILWMQEFVGLCC